MEEIEGKEGETRDQDTGEAMETEGVETGDKDHTLNLHYSSSEEDVLLGDGESGTIPDLEPEKKVPEDMELGSEGERKREGGEGGGEMVEEREGKTMDDTELGCEGVREREEEEEGGRGEEDYSTHNSLEVDTTEEEEEGIGKEGEGERNHQKQ